MALEGVAVPEDEPRGGTRVESALEHHPTRREPRADWVQAQSRIAACGWILPPAARDAALRERGEPDAVRPLSRTYPAAV